MRLVNAGQQLLKSSPDGAGGGVDNGIVEYWFEYDTTSRDDYTNGVNVHTGDNWIIRHNLFRKSRPAGTVAGPAILMWNHSTNTLVDGNTFIECQREIALGLIKRTPNDHSGGSSGTTSSTAAAPAIPPSTLPTRQIRRPCTTPSYLRHIRQPDR